MSERGFDVIEDRAISLSDLDILAHVRLAQLRKFRELLSGPGHRINSIRRRLAIDVGKRMLLRSVFLGLLGSLRIRMVGHTDRGLACPTDAGFLIDEISVMSSAINIRSTRTCDENPLKKLDPKFADGANASCQLPQDNDQVHTSYPLPKQDKPKHLSKYGRSQSKDLPTWIVH